MAAARTAAYTRESHGVTVTQNHVLIRRLPTALFRGAARPTWHLP